jgi:hypothetical protein
MVMQLIDAGYGLEYLPILCARSRTLTGAKDPASREGGIKHYAYGYSQYSVEDRLPPISNFNLLTNLLSIRMPGSLMPRGHPALPKFEIPERWLTEQDVLDYMKANPLPAR